MITSDPSTTFDVIIVGAGIAGINAAYRLQSQLPHLSYAILEARGDIGGTWNLFRYPGIRSDSDLYTFGFAWKPWNQPNPIGDGGAILDYIKQAASQYGIDRHVHVHRRLQNASWSSTDQAWTLTVEDLSGGESDSKGMLYRARFIVITTGYYDYHQPLKADIPGLENFHGQIVHPQFWPETLDYTNKQVVVIGSGATAVTLIPKLAEKAARTTMLQRSPSYIVAIPNDRAGKQSWLARLLPAQIVHSWRRLSFMLWSRMIYLVCQRWPDSARQRLGQAMKAQLPAHLPLDPHFTPRYNPWDQRVCLSPNGDFFQALRAGTADVKTGTIKEVVSDGIVVKNAVTGEGAETNTHIPADIIITATGLKIQLAGGATFDVDGSPVALCDKLLWNGGMLQDIPNMSLVIGYTSISWTLGVDATALLICRVLRMMERKKYSSATPTVEKETVLSPRRLFNLSSTYLTVAEGLLPKAADKAPWLPRINILSDYWLVYFGRVDKGLRFIKGEGLKLKQKAM